MSALTTGAVARPLARTGRYVGFAKRLMKQVGEQVLLRVYLQSADRAPHTPTYQRIVRQARVQNLAGATVLRGIMGYGSQGLLRASAWAVVEHVPVIVEIVDQTERIGQFIHQTLSPLMVHGMITLERASVGMYRHRATDPSAPPQAAPLKTPPAMRPLSTVPILQPSDTMTINENGVLLRVFIGEADRHQHMPLYEAIVRAARELGLAGATVLRGVEGFGANSIVHRAGLLELSTDLPLIIEIVDAQDKIERLLPRLDEMVQEGMITMEYVAIVLYRHNPADAPAAKPPEESRSAQLPGGADIPPASMP